MLGSLRTFPVRVTTAAGLGIRLPRGETKKAFIVGGKICVVEKSFSQPLLQRCWFASSSQKSENKAPPPILTNKKKHKKLSRPGSDMKPPMGLEQLRLHPHETPQEINDRIFGSFPLYREVKERGSTTPVMDAYRESADPIMLEKILQWDYILSCLSPSFNFDVALLNKIDEVQLARDVLPTRTGPRRNNVKKRESLRLKGIRKQNSIYREQKMIALEKKARKKVEKRIRDRDSIAAAIADDAVWLKEKSELILKHQEKISDERAM